MFSKPTNRVAMFAALASLSATTASAQLIWTGSAGDGRWETPGNWDFGVAPEPLDEVIVNGGDVTFSDPAVRIDLIRQAPTTFNNDADFTIVG